LIVYVSFGKVEWFKAYLDSILMVEMLTFSEQTETTRYGVVKEKGRDKALPFNIDYIL